MLGTDDSGTKNARGHRTLFSILAIIYASAIFIYSNIEGVQVDVSGGDKILHVAAYAMLSLLVSQGIKRFPGDVDRLLIVFGIVLLYGITDEIHQHFVPLRSFSYYDMLADAVGSIAGIVLVMVLEKGRKFFLQNSNERVRVKR